jgi:two-component system phosphate regulon sensor histidine kinase PhoR
MVINDQPKIKRFTSIIKQENQRMLSQVEKVLQMALLDKKDFKLRTTQVDMHDIILKAADHIALQVNRRDGAVNTELEAPEHIIEGDVTHLSNIIHNLLDNANKYTIDNPDIVISTDNMGDMLRIIIKDNGVGLSNESQKHIFDKFYRVHTGDLHDVKGFGLGLSYVKAMVAAHKGDIRVKSELGKGSSFIITLPLILDNNHS